MNFPVSSASASVLYQVVESGRVGEQELRGSGAGAAQSCRCLTAYPDASPHACQ